MPLTAETWVVVEGGQFRPPHWTGPSGEKPALKLGRSLGPTLLTAGNHLGLSCDPEGHPRAAELSQPEAEDTRYPLPPIPPRSQGPHSLSADGL